MRQKKIDQLLDKYKAGNCTPDELAFIESWYLTYEEPNTEEPSLAETTEDLDKVWERLNGILHKKQILVWRRMAAAASVLVFIAVGGYYLRQHKQSGQQLITKVQKQVIVPGGNRAILTLSNGKQIILTNARNGTLAKQGATSINKTADGAIVYKANAAAADAALTYNTMTTPNGGQYWITLPDKSKVLLNAASSLRYPTVFTGKERKVELTGEAYFEVAKNRSMPFIVNVNNKMDVKVLGTHFNIMGYDNENKITTTLLEGSVKIEDRLDTKNTAMLIPGQQAEMTSDRHIKLGLADIDEATAWKDGQFIFNNESIYSITRKLSRWYNVNFVFSDRMRDKRFDGTISKYKNISEVLKLMGLTKSVHFKIEERRILVMP